MRILNFVPRRLILASRVAGLGLLLVCPAIVGYAFPDPSPSPQELQGETPVPSPTPSPTPVPDPRLSEVTKHWTLLKVIDRQIVFIDSRSKTEYSMKIGDTIIAPAGRKPIRVVLESVDIEKSSATFRYDGAQGVQRETLTVAAESK